MVGNKGGTWKVSKDWRHLNIMLSIVAVILAVFVFGFFYLLNKLISLLN